MHNKRTRSGQTLLATTLAGIAILSIFGVSVAISATGGSDYPIEVVRAHANYKSGSASTPGFTTHGFLPVSVSPDVILGRASASSSAGTKGLLLEAAGYMR